MIEETPSKNPSETNPVVAQPAPDGSPQGGPTPGNPLPGSPALARRASAQQQAEEDDGPFPGWYPDPLGRAAERFWNGREWTTNSRGEVAPPSAVPSTIASGSTMQAGSREDVASPRPRIFGNNPEDPGKIAEDDEVTAAAASVLTPSGPASTPPSASSTPQGEEVKSAPPEWSETGSPTSAPAGSQLFPDAAETRAAEPANPASQAPAPTPPPSTRMAQTPTPPTAQTSTVVEADPVVPDVAELAPDEVSSEAPRRRSWLALVLAGLCALALGLAVGWFGRGSSDNQDASPVTTSAEQADQPDDAGTVEGNDTVGDDNATDNDNDTVDSGPDPAPADTAEVDQLQAEIDALSSDLNDAQTEVETLTAERDNEQAHNDILLTWFTPEVRNRSERNWNAEVARACAVDAEPTVENTSYTRSMELMGTHADLVVAVATCQAGG